MGKIARKIWRKEKFKGGSAESFTTELNKTNTEKLRKSTARKFRTRILKSREVGDGQSQQRGRSNWGYPGPCSKKEKKKKMHRTGSILKGSFTFSGENVAKQTQKGGQTPRS